MTEAAEKEFDPIEIGRELEEAIDGRMSLLVATRKSWTLKELINEYITVMNEKAQGLFDPNDHEVNVVLLDKALTMLTADLLALSSCNHAARIDLNEYAARRALIMKAMREANDESVQSPRLDS